MSIATSLRAAALAACPPSQREELARTLDARAAHRRTGIAARASGDTLEHWLDAQHEAALALGILVRVGHYGPAATITGKRDARGRLLAAIDGKAPPDYLGILRGGRALVVEAKRRTGRLRRDDSREGIPAHQAAWLDAADRCGALALVVVEFVRAAGATRYAVPWGEIPWEGDSVGPSALAPWRVQGELYLARWTSGPSVASGRPQGAVPGQRGGAL